MATSFVDSGYSDKYRKELKEEILGNRQIQFLPYNKAKEFLTLQESVRKHIADYKIEKNPEKKQILLDELKDLYKDDLKPLCQNNAYRDCFAFRMTLLACEYFLNKQFEAQV